MRKSGIWMRAKGCFAQVMWIIAGSSGRLAIATDIQSPANIISNTGVMLRFESKDTIGVYTPYIWDLDGSNFGFSLSAGGNIPFNVQPPTSSRNAIYITPDGNVGMGTIDAQRELQISGDDTPTIRLEQTNFGSFPARTWGIEANDQHFQIHDVTGGTKRPFKIKAEAPTNSLIIGGTGRIGVGTETPDANSQMEVRSSVINSLLLKRTTGDSNYLRVENSIGVFRAGVEGTGNAQFGALGATKGLNLLAGGSSKMVINAGGQVSFGNPPPAIPPTHAMTTSTGAHLTFGGVWTNNSTRAAKQDIEPISSEQARDTVRALQPVGYRYKNELDERYVGFIAEDVPELVATNDRKGLASMDITAVLTKVVQDQDRLLVDQGQQLTEARRTIAQQQELLTSLSKRLAVIERKSERVE